MRRWELPAKVSRLPCCRTAEQNRIETPSLRISQVMSRGAMTRIGVPRLQCQFDGWHVQRRQEPIGVNVRLRRIVASVAQEA